MRIAFVGKKNSGKSTAAKIIADKFSDTTVLDFMKPVRQMIVAAFAAQDSMPCELKDFYEVKTPESRRLIVAFADYIRSKNPMAFVDYLLHPLQDKRRRQSEYIIVENCRMLIEAEILKKEGFLLVRIIRNTGEQDPHITETEQDQIVCDAEIENNGTLEELQVKVLCLLEKETKCKS